MRLVLLGDVMLGRLVNQRGRNPPRLAGKSAQRIAARMQGLCAGLGTQSEWSAATDVLEIPVGG